MDPEQTFLRVHARMSGMLSRLLTPRIRSSLEFIFFVVAVALFGLLVVMHTNFVEQPGCSSEFSGVDIAEAHIVQIKISSSGLWLQNAADHNVMMVTPENGRLTESSKVSNVDGGRWMSLASKFWISLGARWSKLMLKSWNNYKKLLVPQVESVTYCSNPNLIVDETNIKVDTVATHVGLPKSARESFRTTVIHLFGEWRMHFSSLLMNAKQLSGNVNILWNIAGSDILLDIPKGLHMERVSSFIVKWMEKRSKAFEPTYLYTVEKGYFLLPEEAKSRHNVWIVNISIPARHPCFGNRWQQLLINSFVGYDTILMNSLLSSPGQGYLYNFQTKEFYDLSYAHKPKENLLASVSDMITTKCSVLIMSLFVFFTTTMSVSFTLRETQSRMVKFTVQLQHHARDQLPTFQLIFAHVIEFLVFVPIMIGILFFLFEFYDDQLLAFLVLTLVWLCELFMLISVRTPISMQFFPRFFFLYFLIFHVYFFSYAYGFSYLAFSSTAAFMLHSILYFWNRYEVPALERFIRSRSSLQQQPGVHISSTILTSTLHIARVNVRNQAPGNNEFGSGPWPRSPWANQSRPGDFAEGVGFGGIIEPSATNNRIQ